MSGLRAIKQALVILCVWILLAYGLLSSSGVVAAEISVTLKDGLDGSLVTETDVTAHRINSDGSRSWFKRTATDATGTVTFDLPDLDNGGRYQFSVSAFNSTRLYSEIIERSQDVEFIAGSKIVLLKDGSKLNTPPLAQHKVTAKYKNDDGKKIWVDNATSDEDGVVRFNLSNEIDNYRFQSKSVLTGDNKYSNETSSQGTFSFVVGNLPLHVNLKHGIDNYPIANQRVWAKRYAEDGSVRHAYRKETNAQGQVIFDLDELGQGARYQLYTQDSNGFKGWIDVTEPGELEFAFGDTRIELISGRDAQLPALSDTNVSLFASINGQRKRIASATSNTQGKALFDLSDYVAHFPITARLRIESKNYEASLSQLGESRLVFGKLPQTINVHLHNTANNQPIVAQNVTLYRWEGEQKKWTARQATDESGRVSFDAQGMHEGVRYFVETRPFDGPAIRSDTLNEPTDVAFNLFMQTDGLTLTLIDGTQSSRPIINGQRVDVYRVLNGERKWVTRKSTDENGRIKLTLADMDQSPEYVFKTAHPVTGRGIYSEAYSQNGDFELSVGEIPLHITVVNPVTQQPLPQTEVRVYRIAADGSLKGKGRETTDESGQVTFYLSEISEASPIVVRARTDSGFQHQVRFTVTGQHTLPLGDTQLTLLNGRVDEQSVLANTYVKLYKQSGETKERVATFYSDNNGQVLLQRPELHPSESLIAQVRYEGKNYEAPLTQDSEQGLVFGKLPQWVNIAVINSKTNTPVSNLSVKLYEIIGEERKHRMRKDTDENGQAQFDVQGLYEGKAYQVAIRPFDGAPLYSDVFDTPTDIAFSPYFHEHGIIVDVRNGALPDQPALIGEKVNVYRWEDGEKSWYSNQYSDDNGQLRLKLADLEKGQLYVLSAQSQTNGSRRYSMPFGDVDNYQFVVGNLPVSVSLIHGISGAPIQNRRVTAYQLQEDGEYKWYNRQESNADGIALFDLEGLGNGKTYRFRADVLATGASYSQPIAEVQDVNMRIGNVPIRLINAEDNTAISGTRITALWLDESNKQHWESRGDTDNSGDLLFDLRKLQEGYRYVVKAHNPFGENKRYYGPIIYDEGAVDFIIRKGEYGDLDLHQPEVAITSPTRNNVNSAGFVLHGTASDDTSIGEVTVTITDPIHGATEGTATLLANNNWQFDVPGTAISANSDIDIVVTAFDSARNQAGASARYSVIDDQLPPSVSIVSHQNNDTVNETGFTVIGEATDDTGNVQIEASLYDPVLGITVSQQRLGVAENGQWAFIVTNGKVTGGETIELSFTAIDFSDKRTDLGLRLIVQSVVPQQQQLISRTTFGMTPELYINQPSAEAFLEQQLNPSEIDDSALEAMLTQLPLETADDLRTWLLTRMIYSQRQLNEVMAWFWENHFNTSINTHENINFELQENIGFRTHALGYFRDLLEVSAKSPAMVYYLNNAQNIAGNANENYAREIMELHTLGVDGGYTQQDVTELARIFTGWHERDGNFFFDESLHDFGDKQILGVNIDGSGIAEGEQVLDLLALHPSTARNLCTKLITLFVSDSPVSNLQMQCEGEYLATGGHISSVLSVLFGSEAFVALEHQASKIKTPLELVISAVRNVSATPDFRELLRTLYRMGHPLFDFPVPTGLSERGRDWLTSDALLQRIRFANRMALEGEEGASADIHSLLMALGYSAPEAIVGIIADLTLNGRLSDIERDMLLDLLNENLPEGEAFDMNAPYAPETLQRLLGTVLSLPAFQYQ